MTIGKKLYLRFGAILAIMILLLVMNIVAVRRQSDARTAVASTLFDVQMIESVRYKIMENRLALGDYLLSGDRRDEDRTNRGIADLQQLLHQGEGLAIDPELRGALSQVEDTERNWANEFAIDMIAKRHQVDAGKSSISDLEAYYLQHGPGAWINKSTNILDEASRAVRRAQEKSTSRRTRRRCGVALSRQWEHCLWC